MSSFEESFVSMLKEFLLEKFRESNSKVDGFKEKGKKTFFFFLKSKFFRESIRNDVVASSDVIIAFISDEITIRDRPLSRQTKS